MAKVLTKKRRKFLWKFWGYLLIPIVAIGLFALSFGAAPIAVLSSLILAYMLVQAPMPCGAENRARDRLTGEPTFCRHNAHGLLGGCNQVYAHRWANVRLLTSKSQLGVFWRNLTRDSRGIAAAVSALAATASALVAVGALLVNIGK